MAFIAALIVCIQMHENKTKETKCIRNISIIVDIQLDNLMNDLLVIYEHEFRGSDTVSTYFCQQTIYLTPHRIIQIL